MTAKVGNVTFFAKDPHAQAEFWSAVMGYPFDGKYPPDLEKALRDAGLDDDALAARSVAWDDNPAHQRFFFHRMSRPKQHSNRMHLDINMFEDRKAKPEELDAERDRVIALGGSLEKTIDGMWGPIREYFHMMRDPEGNEFCLH